MMRLKPIAVATLAMSALLTGAAAPEKPYRITFIPSLAGNPFYETVACGAQEAAKRLGVELNVQAPQQYQAALQIGVLDAVIAAHPDGILFTAADPVALTPTLNGAKQKGIKILSIDGDVSDMGIAVANVQSDNTDGGRQAAIKLAELIGGKGKVLALMNTPAPTVSAQRLDGFKAELAAHYPGITFLGVQYSNNQTAKAAAIVTSTIAANPDLAGVFTITTNNTEGAATGLREANMVGKIKLVGFDTSDPIVEDIRKGIVQADVVQYPYGVGQLGVELMVKALKGEPVDREVHTPFVIATPQTIDTPEVQKFVYKTHCS
jgi:ribose transport system substrate-binding protein